MSDLVIRLREYSLPGAEDYPDWHPEICDEAAGEIALLRAALREIVEYKEKSTDPDWEKVDAMRDIAGAALDHAHGNEGT